MAPKFGTSGLRGLVTELTDDLLAGHVHAFLATCETGGTLCVGRDLRESSPRIAKIVIDAAMSAGCRVIDCGALPTPALALAAQERGSGAIMVTGSHIPADRNGLKFYGREGEITKAEETAIRRSLQTATPGPKTLPGVLEQDTGALDRFRRRYTSAFGPVTFTGRRIGVFAHSAVGRDMLSDLLTLLGAEIVELGRSDSFIPVDTEAVDLQTRERIRDWVETHGLDALVSTDGDSDRPLLADETGQIVPGDIMGQITAESLGADTVVTPVSSNTGVMRKRFRKIVSTAIGSPFVIAAMQAEQGAVVGYEANGGFLLGFPAQGPEGPIAPLLTRDCVLPLLVTLKAADGEALSGRIAQEPPVFTRSDRLQNVPQDQSRGMIERLTCDAGARAAFLGPLGKAEAHLDQMDGLRMVLQDDTVIHIRPSGNAPELRLYVEATSPSDADALMRQALARLRETLVR